jgi:hypothetical protein
MIKGHHIDGEISTNRHMRARGITCAVHDTMAANRNAANQSTDCPETPCAEKSCTTCTN